MKKSVLIAVATFLSITIFAQDSSYQNELNEVVITATKYPLKLSETGKVLTVITKEQIEKSGGKDLAQLLNEQTGIVVNGANSTPGKDQSIFIRGASNKYTLVLLDGIPVTDPTGVGGAFDPRLLSLDLVERIEILKGSQSTLYGSDVLAGVINIITKKGSDKAVGGSLGVNYGSYNSVNATAGLKGSKDWFDYNLNYAYTSSEGLSQATDTTGKNNFDKDGFVRHSFQSNIQIRPMKNLELNPFYRYSYDKGDFDPDAFMDGNNSFSYLLNNAGLSADYVLPKGSLTAKYSYSFIKRNYANDWGFDHYSGNFQSSEIYLTQSITKWIKMVAGFNWQKYALSDTTPVHKNPSTNIISPYASFLWRTPGGLSIEAGGRLNHHSVYGNNLTYSINTAYDIASHMKVFANYSTGFKSPTVTELFGLWGANDELKPEISNSFEAGVQTELAANKLQLNITAFKRDISELIVYFNNKYENMDKQKDHGLELELNYQPNKKWFFKAAYTYLDGKIEQSRNGKDTSFDNLIRKPRNVIGVFASYAPSSNWYFNFNLQSLGARNDLYFQPVPPFDVINVKLDPYVLLNAYAEYKWTKKHIRFFIDLKNITSSNYTEVYGYNTLKSNGNGGVKVAF